MLFGIVLPSLFLVALVFSKASESHCEILPFASPLANHIFSLHLFVESGKRSTGSVAGVNRRPLTPYGGLSSQPGWLRGKVHEEGTIRSGRSSLVEREFLGRCRANAHRCLRFRRVAPPYASIASSDPGREADLRSVSTEPDDPILSLIAKANNPANRVTFGRDILKMEWVRSGKSAAYEFVIRLRELLYSRKCIKLAERMA